MRTSRWLGFLVIGVLAGCGTVLLSQPMERKAKGVTLTLTKVKDGPNSYATGGRTDYVPPDDNRFLWFTITIRNDSGASSTFNYDRCGVDFGGDEILPALVDKDSAINILADKEEELGAGEEISRNLVFAYPEDRYPSRLTCGEAVFELSLKQ